ncbi:MAG TPA: hypothetical protein VMF29_04875 [Candidatus Edwardsbacteria bacterium]|nr:hypothetical protein [Candidatus Edwardsbacteria bacterium]
MMGDVRNSKKNAIVSVGLLLLAALTGRAQELKVYELHGLPAGGYAVYASEAMDYSGKNSSARTTVSWLAQQSDGGVWLEFARDEGRRSTAVKVLAGPDGRVRKMTAAQGSAAAAAPEKLPAQATVLCDRNGMQDRGTETVSTPAGTFDCRHYASTASEDTRSRHGDLTLVTTVERQRDVWVSQSGGFRGLVRQRTTARLSERTYLGDRPLPKNSPVRERTETVELQRVASSGAASRIKPSAASTR